MLDSILDWSLKVTRRRRPQRREASQVVETPNDSEDLAAAYAELRAVLTEVSAGSVDVYSRGAEAGPDDIRALADSLRSLKEPAAA